MSRSLPMWLFVSVIASSGAGCFTSPLPCQTEAVDVSGSVTDSEGELLAPQAAAVTLRHSPDGCLVFADVTVVGPGGQDCEMRAVADQPRAAGGLAVTSLRVTSTGDCGWPASVNGDSAGAGDSYVVVEGVVDVAGGSGDNACVTGAVTLELVTTLSGNSTETLSGAMRVTGGLLSVEDPLAVCPAGAGDDDDSAGDDDDSAR